METNYDVDYFIRKFEAIPAYRWITGNWEAGISCCVNGHCGIRKSFDVSKEAESLWRLFDNLPLTAISDEFLVKSGTILYSVGIAIKN